MEANELRIGNWVTVGEHSNFQVQLINLKNKFEPILLTPELLIAAGFEWQASGYSGFYKDTGNKWSMRIWQNDDHDFLYSISDYNAISLFHIHQLQNLYFALTGQELNIQL